MRGILAGLFAALLALSVAGAADACPFMGGDTKDAPKPSAGA